MREDGFLHVILALLLFIVLVVAIFVAGVIGLDQMQRETSSQSMFNKDAKLGQIVDRLNRRSDELAARKVPTDVKRRKQRGATIDERLDEVERSFESGPE